MSDRVHIIGHFVPNAVLRTIKHSPDTLIECHAAAAAVLRMNNAQSKVALEVVPIMRGVKGDKPAHIWTGTSISWENPDGSFGASVNLKGESGGNYLTVCLNAAQIAAKQITLPSVPQSEVQMQVVGGTAQKQNIDFFVNSQSLGWDGLALELLLEQGDYLSISYS